MNRPLVRVVLVELGGADATSLARTLRDEGVEVVHAGVLRTAGQVASTVEQEDPDALGLVGDDPELARAVVASAGIPVFGVGAGTAESGIRGFGNDSEAAEWVARVAIHSPEAPPERTR